MLEYLADADHIGTCVAQWYPGGVAANNLDPMSCRLLQSRLDEVDADMAIPLVHHMGVQQPAAATHIQQYRIRLWCWRNQPRSRCGDPMQHGEGTRWPPPLAHQFVVLGYIVAPHQ
jgi:hypothetical protein